MDEYLRTELKLLETKLTDKIESQNIILTQILEQVKKTNGRVGKLEEWRHEHELETAEELMEYKFLKKYPRLTIILLIVMIIVALAKYINP